MRSEPHQCRCVLIEKRNRSGWGRAGGCVEDEAAGLCRITTVNSSMWRPFGLFSLASSSWRAVAGSWRASGGGPVVTTAYRVHNSTLVLGLSMGGTGVLACRLTITSTEGDYLITSPIHTTTQPPPPISGHCDRAPILRHALLLSSQA